MRGFDPWGSSGRSPGIVSKWQLTPVFLPGESHGQRSLAGHSPWCCRVGHTGHFLDQYSLHGSVSCKIQ